METATLKRNLKEKYATPLTSPYARIRIILQTQSTAGDLDIGQVLSRAKLSDTKRNRRLVSTIRCQLKADVKTRKAESHREALRSLKSLGIIHLERFGFACSAPPELVRLIGEVVVRGKRVGAWYRADNRNGMLVFADPANGFTVQLYRSGSCRIPVSRKLQKELVTLHDAARLHDRVEKTFFNEMLRRCGGDPSDPNVMPVRGFMDGLFWKRYVKWMNTFGVVRRHRVFTVLGKHHSFPPFRIETYKEAGLVIYNDGSHPHSIEVDETIPVSLSRMMFDLVMRNAELLEELLKVEKGNHDELLQTRQAIVHLSNSIAQFLTVATEQTTALKQLDETMHDLIAATKKPPPKTDRRLFT